jgi:hypothetical protein
LSIFNAGRRKFEHPAEEKHRNGVASPKTRDNDRLSENMNNLLEETVTNLKSFKSQKKHWGRERCHKRNTFHQH